MKNILVCLFFLCSTHLVVAQVGLSGSFVKISAPDWEKLFVDSDKYDFGPDFQFEPSYQLGIDYWFRLKAYRIEFFPTLAFAQFKQEQALLNGIGSDPVSQFKLSFVNFSVHTNIYPFDFEGDCHCPTWSKQNPFFKKGFFFQVSPGVMYSRHDITEAEGNATTFESSDVSFNLGAGLGVDIGISDLLTVTPYARIKRDFGVEWEGLYSHLNTGTARDAGNKTSVNQFEAGIRLGIRWTK